MPLPLDDLDWDKLLYDGPVAQRIEHGPSKSGVAGSSPARPLEQPENPAHKLLADMRKRIEERGEAITKKQLVKPKARNNPGRYTTDAAIAWGRRQKPAEGAPAHFFRWKLIDREHYDARLKRHHDLEGAVDALFDSGDPEGWRYGLQGAGVDERTRHWNSFVAWGMGEDPVVKARRRKLRVIYLVFERNNPEPLSIEYWS